MVSSVASLQKKDPGFKYTHWDSFMLSLHVPVLLLYATLKWLEV